MEQSLSNLAQFNSRCKLRQIVRVYISSKYAQKDEVQQLANVFSRLDKNKDGYLSKEELMNGWQDVYGSAVSEQEIDSIMSAADADQSGNIKFDEFIAAAGSQRTMFCKEHMIHAFRTFDANGDGKISAEELRQALGSDISEQQVFTELLATADRDGDGFLSLAEFKRLLLPSKKH
jgi:calcium-dependent protein kinase